MSRALDWLIPAGELDEFHPLAPHAMFPFFWGFDGDDDDGMNGPRVSNPLIVRIVNEENVLYEFDIAEVLEKDYYDCDADPVWVEATASALEKLAARLRETSCPQDALTEHKQNESSTIPAFGALENPQKDGE